jgi:hypothetical protein
MADWFKDSVSEAARWAMTATLRMTTLDIAGRPKAYAG